MTDGPLHHYEGLTRPRTWAWCAPADRADRIAAHFAGPRRTRGVGRPAHRPARAGGVPTDTCGGRLGSTGFHPAGAPVTDLRSGVDAWRRPPAPLAELIGRTAERTAAADSLTLTRLLTLTGVGGSGKTRLALAVATDVAGRYRDGAVWVDLAAIVDPSLVAAAVADAVGLRGRRSTGPDVPGGSDEPDSAEGTDGSDGSVRPTRSTAPQGSDRLQDALCEHLRESEALLIVDNCEHLLDGCRPLLAALLRAAPGVGVLATSRTALRLEGEVCRPVPPLAVPPADPADAAAVVDTDAVRLFELRARQVRPGFRATDDIDAVARVCRRLDGLPLALELAAARIRVLTPAQLATALDDRFAVLTGGRHDALPRQRTLAASVEWSTSLLEDHERRVFARLGVFAGAFDLEAARDVVAGGGVPSEEVLDLLTRLAEHSLLQVDATSATARYRLLETIRAHARELLAELEDPSEAMGRHLDHYLGVATDAHPGLVGPEPERWLEALDVQLEELRTAMDRALLLGRPLAVVAMAEAAFVFFSTRGHYAELRRRLADAAASPSLTDAERARAYTRASISALMGGDYQGGHSFAHVAVQAAEAAGDTETLARALAYRAWCGCFAGVAAPSTVDADVQRALELGAAVDDPEVHGRAALYAGALEMLCGGIPDGHRLLADAAEELEAAGLVYMLAPVHTFRAYGDAMLDGDLAVARAHAHRALRLAEQLDLPAFVCMASTALGAIATLSGDAEVARHHLAVAHEAAARRGLTTFVMIAHRWMAYAAYRFDDPDAASSLRTAGLLADDTGSAWDRAAAEWLEGVMALRRGRIEDASDAFRRVLDTSRVPAWPFALARAELGLALAAAAVDDVEMAWEHAHEALTCAEAHGDRVLAADILEHLADLQVTRGELDDAARLREATETFRRASGIGRAPLEADRWAARSSPLAADPVRADGSAEGAGDEAGGPRPDWAAVFDAAIRHARRGRGPRRRPPTGWAALTPAEQEVVALVAEGCSNRTIAERLFISVNTVKTHLSHIYTKTGAGSRTALAAEATHRQAAGHDEGPG